MFKDDELRPIMESTAYHSPELSVSDEESSTDEMKIVTKDLAWRSTTVSKIGKFNWLI